MYEAGLAGYQILVQKTREAGIGGIVAVIAQDKQLSLRYLYLRHIIAHIPSPPATIATCIYLSISMLDIRLRQFLTIPVNLLVDDFYHISAFGRQSHDIVLILIKGIFENN